MANKESTPSLEELRIRRTVQASVLNRILGSTPLPNIPPPSLKELKASVPAPGISDEELASRINAFCEARLPRRARSAGEKIAPGDELTINIVGYVDGKHLPYSAMEARMFLCAPDPALPGLAESLVGATVGQIVQAKVILPSNYRVAAFQNKPAVFAVKILHAVEVTRLDPKAPDFLSRLGLPNSLEEIFKHVGDEAGREKAIELRRQVLDSLLDELMTRTTPNIPDALIDQEIGRRWLRVEGDFLTKMNVAAEDRERALAAWLEDAGLRAEIKRALSHTQVLFAVAEGEKISVTVDEVKELIEQWTQALQLDPKEVAKSFAEDPSAGTWVTSNALLLKVMDQLLSRAEIGET